MDLTTIVLDVLIISAVSIVMMVLLGIISQRLLDVRISNGRILFAGLLGLGAGIGFESRFVWQAEDYTPAILPIVAGIIIFVTISALVIAELLVPQGSLPRPDQWIPAAKQALSRNKRYAQFLQIAGKHRLFTIKLGPAALQLSPQERHKQALMLKSALEEAGGAFVKIGQLLSTRPDVMPPEFLAVLKTLQQDVSAVPWEQVKPALERSVGRPYREVFADFNHEPFAAASIGQVHRAVLRSGEPVAVKVRRPGIVELIKRDTDIVERWARRFARSSDWAAQIGVEDLVKTLAENLREELDYQLEATNMAALEVTQQQLPANARVRIPHCNAELSRDDLLVMEFVSGSTLSDPKAIENLSAVTGQRLARQLLASTLAQIMVAGVFHSDLHPGNIIVTEDAELVLLDFGSIGRIDSETRTRLTEVLFALSKRDASAFASGLVGFVDLTDGVDEHALRRAIATFMARRLGPGAQLDATTFSEVVAILSAYGITVPAEITVPFHTIATLDGSLNILDPTFDLVKEAGVFADQRTKDGLRPDSVIHSLNDELMRALPIIRQLPKRLDRITGLMADGRFNINMRLAADARDRDFFRSIISLAVITFLAGISGVMGAMLLSSTTGPQLTDTLNLFHVFGYLTLLVSGVLTLRALFDVLRRRGRTR